MLVPDTAPRFPARSNRRATLHSHRDRGVPDEARPILAEGLVAHVGITEGEQPFVLPMTYHFDPAVPDRIYLHGGQHARLLRHLASGAPVCLAVTLVDGLVFSRTALYHSVNYRSVVCFARLAQAQPVAPARRALLEQMIARYFPGRTVGRDYAAISDAHLEATAFVALEIEEISAKARRGGPTGPLDADPHAPGTAGVVPRSDGGVLSFPRRRRSPLWRRLASWVRGAGAAWLRYATAPGTWPER
jgi:nitroimidazol reductase NimA-like FMN-containing flavoprotein (pyridoxamine 5'-phosphate oxidase superfamily)